MIRKIFAQRRHGKTTRMVEMAIVENLFIVCPTSKHVSNLHKFAEKQGKELKPDQVITLADLQNNWNSSKGYSGGKFMRPKVIFDDFDLMIETLFPFAKVRGLTMTIDHEEDCVDP